MKRVNIVVILALASTSLVARPQTMDVKGCVKKTRRRCAVRKMKVDPSKPSCRGRLQTAMSCFGQKPRW